MSQARVASFSLVVAACGSVATTTDGGFDATINEGSTDSMSADDVVADHPLPRYPIVDASGDCAKPSDDATFSSCCNNEPCRGFCVVEEDGGVGCSCFGIPGGCEADRALVCCQRARGCTASGACYYIK